VVTVEGLVHDGQLDLIQQEFMDEGAVQWVLHAGHVDLGAGAADPYAASDRGADSARRWWATCVVAPAIPASCRRSRRRRAVAGVKGERQERKMGEEKQTLILSAKVSSA